MIVRSAFLEGTVADADRAWFDGQMAGSVLDAIRTYPGIRAVRLRRTVQIDEGTPPNYMVFDLYSTSNLQAMDAALASPPPGGSGADRAGHGSVPGSRLPPGVP